MPDTPVQPSPDQLTGEQTRAQTNPFDVLGMLGFGVLYASGGCAANPCAFPGYGTLYGRSYHTYRWMLQHPVIRHARMTAIGPAIASESDYKKREDGVSDEWVDLVRRNLEPMDRRLKGDTLGRGRDYGWAPFEPIWDVAGGEWRLQEVKLLLQDITTIVADNKGRFMGLAQGGLDDAGLRVKGANGQDTNGLPAPYKAWVYTYDREAGNLYGRPWLENIRETAWKDWLDCAQQLQKLGGKIAGVQAIAKAPLSQKEQVIASVKALAAGASGAYLETMPFAITASQLVNNPELWKLVMNLMKATVSDITPLDFGSSTPAIMGFLERMKHDEELMFNGALLSSRTGMEGQHGTKAEAQVHKDTGVTVAELDADDHAEQLQPLVDALLVLNYGPTAAGSVRIDPPPLVDQKAARAQAWLDAITKPGAVALALAKITDGLQLAKDLEAPVVDGAKFEILEQAPPAIPDPNALPLNGNKRPMSPRLQKAVARFGGRTT